MMGVYPHVYGATIIHFIDEPMGTGLSPCVWGHRIRSKLQTFDGGSIPMCMGPPPSTARYGSPPGVYPHVYGATSIEVYKIQDHDGLSPCVWGHHRSQQTGEGRGGCSPMCRWAAAHCEVGES